MKKFIALALFAMLSCTTKKTETAGPLDSVAADSSILATSPAPPDLAFNPIPGFYLNNSLKLADSTNYFLLGSQEELNKILGMNKAAGAEIVAPDFTINYNVAVACSSTKKLTTILMDSVEARDQTISIYLTIRRGEAQKVLSKPTQLFAIERRSGFSNLQFFVNGKLDKAIVLPMD